MGRNIDLFRFDGRYKSIKELLLEGVVSSPESDSELRSSPFSPAIICTFFTRPFIYKDDNKLRFYVQSCEYGRFFTDLIRPADCTASQCAPGLIVLCEPIASSGARRTIENVFKKHTK